MNCEEVRNLLSEYIDRALSSDQAEAVEQHLRTCEICRAEYDALVSVTSLLGEIPEMTLPEGFDRRLRSTLEENGRASFVSQKKKIRWRWISAAAATFVIGFSTMAVYNHMSEIFPQQDSVQFEAAQEDLFYAGNPESELTSDAGISNEECPVQYSIAANEALEQTVQEPLATQNSHETQEEPATGISEASDAIRSAPETSADVSDEEPIADEEETAPEDAPMADVSRHLPDATTTQQALGLHQLPGDTSTLSARDAAAVLYYVKRIEKQLSGFEYTIVTYHLDEEGIWRFEVNLNTYDEAGEEMTERVYYAGQDGNLWRTESSSSTETAY